MSPELHKKLQETMKPGGIVGKKIEWMIHDEVNSKVRGKFAPVVPYHFYQQFQLHGYKPGSVLLLAHDVVQHSKEYNEIFQDKFWDGVNIFMDNSLVELKKAVDIEMVADAVNAIGRKQIVVICPDVMAEAQASAKLTKDSWPEWSWRFREHQKLVVIQGSTIGGFLECAEELADLYPEWVSIPRVTEGLFGYHRAELIPYVEAIYPGAKIHLLGFSDYIWQDLRAAADGSVQSIDSAVPFRMSTNKIFSETVPPRGDWWETAKFDVSMIERAQHIDNLISLL